MANIINKIFDRINKVSDEDILYAEMEMLYKKLRTGYISEEQFKKDFWDWYWNPRGYGHYHYRPVKRNGLWTIRDVLELKAGL